MSTVGEWWMWPIFIFFVVVMLLIDLFLCGGKKAHRISTREALAWTCTWIILAFVFNFLLWLYLYHTVNSGFANQHALEFFSGYLIEKCLSIDNVFVFLMIFSYFAVPPEYQRRVLLYGVIGAIFMRFIMILLGAWLISQFHWVLYLFGFFLLVLGIKMIIFSNNNKGLENNLVITLMKKYFRVTTEFHAENFFVIQNKLLYVTPLFLVLILIEVTDLIFAVDSIPAIFSVTDDPFIVFTSNIFAILGLRALYFLIVNLSDKFHYLRHGLAFILGFVGLKLLVSYWVKVPVLLTLIVVFITFSLCIVFSIRKARALKSVSPLSGSSH
jgi:tellurite resistance protein TerC